MVCYFYFGILLRISFSGSFRFFEGWRRATLVVWVVDFFGDGVDGWSREVTFGFFMGWVFWFVCSVGGFWFFIGVEFLCIVRWTCFFCSVKFGRYNCLLFWYWFFG